MRHYLRYDQNGELVGCDTRTFGWPGSADPRDPDTTDAVARWLQTIRTGAVPAFNGWAAYDCSCSRDVGSCLCPYNLIPNHYFNGKVLFPKPDLTVEVDGIPVGAEKILAPPGATVELRLRASVPDQHVVSVTNVMGCSVSLLDDCELTFSGGLSSVVEVLAPQQGICGTISGKSKYVREFRLTLLGWG